MAKINPQKKIQKRHTEDEMRQALHNFIMGNAGGSPIPQDDDDDVVLQDCIEELLEARQTIEEIRGFVSTWSARFARKL